MYELAFKVAGFPPFWWTLDRIGDPEIVAEIYSIAFQIVENGPDLPGAERTRIALPPLLLDAWDLSLGVTHGFITYAEWNGGRILLVSLTLYD